LLVLYQIVFGLDLDYYYYHVSTTVEKLTVLQGQKTNENCTYTARTELCVEGIQLP